MTVDKMCVDIANLDQNGESTINIREFFESFYSTSFESVLSWDVEKDHRRLSLVDISKIGEKKHFPKEK